MKKVLYIFAIVAIIAVVYLLMTVMHPVIYDICSTVNTTANSTTSEDYDLARAVVLGFPFWLWFIPGAIGAVTVIIVLKSDID